MKNSCVSKNLVRMALEFLEISNIWLIVKSASVFSLLYHMSFSFWKMRLKNK